MENAVSWAKNHGLMIVIDLHGAPGSQNGTLIRHRRAAQRNLMFTHRLRQLGSAYEHPAVADEGQLRHSHRRNHQDPREQVQG
jgi:hypothetical protein